MKLSGLVLLGLAGFALGFLWGAGTRNALPGATRTSYANGVITVQVDAGQALGAGLQSLT